MSGIYNIATALAPHRRLSTETFFISDNMTSEVNADQQTIDQSLANVANDIVDSLKFPEKAHAAPIPEFDSLVDMIHRLKAIVYPGFRSNESSPLKVRTELSAQLADAHQILSRQIAIAIARHCEACEDMQFSDCNDADKPKFNRPSDLLAHSRQVASDYIAMMPRIRAALLTDVKAAYVGDPACKNFDEVILCYPGLNAITVHRLAHELYTLKVPFLPRMMAEWVHGETGVDIHPGATIGDHFFIDHGTGVVIGETCIIGEHVKIYQGVTLGALSFPQDEMGQLIRDSKRHPTIEDNVVIYANATVLGGETTVGHDSVVGSNVWLTHSVEPTTTVIMEKPKLRLRNQTKSVLEPPMDFQI
ncbi:MAG: serine O-acetyltransferase [Mariniblastus sp.]|jgi:serine O-acetyltransferase